MKIRLRNRLRMCALFSLLLAYGLQSAQAQTYRVLFQFRAGMDGAAPLAGLVSDPNGNLYGTTSSDGAFDSGVVFKISAPHKETVLHSFTGSGGDGEYPLAGLVRDAAGSLYGTTANGGVYGGACGGFGCGTVFKVNSAGREIVLHRFTGSPDASTPYSGLVRDEAGNLYGTTFSGGQYGFGTVFEINKDGDESVLYSFNPSNGDGAFPYGGLARDAAGNLYGTTDGSGKFGDGTVFKVDTNGAETILYNFGSYSGDGTLPSGALIRDAAGNLYGTTQSGGTLGLGTVFKVDTTGKETLLHSFAGGTKDGEVPFLAGLVRDSKGNLYGATNEGGRFSFGTVFKVAPSGKEILLHSFDGKDGKIPYGSLILDGKGNLYGTASAGGAYGGGGVYEVVP
jgi:uncharacterized repeat protein (TIGR03803 family)